MANQLTLHLKKEDFEQLKRGETIEDFRLRTPYWTKRLVGQKHKKVRVLCGYPKRGSKPRQLVCRFRGWEPKVISHPQFGKQPVRVFAIAVSNR